MPKAPELQYGSMFEAIAETVQPLLRTGKVASYIPALAEISA